MSIDPLRRRLLQLGAGLTLGGLWRAQAALSPQPARRPVKACILVFLYGGPSHLETFDPKPLAPSEYRGEFKPLATSATGVRIGEHLPRLARLMHKAAIVRSMHHAEHLHDAGSIHALTGRRIEGPDRELFAPLPQFFPSYGSAVAAHRPPCEVPFASLPFVFNNVVPTPAQGAGILGPAYDPLLIEGHGTGYRAEAFRPAEGVDRPRRESRRSLLHAIARAPKDPLREKAHRLLDSPALHRALDIDKEPARVRERYGFWDGLSRIRGQNFLLARRLVEAGVPFVNVYDFKQQGQNWDAHAKCCEQHRTTLLPPLDRGLSALIEDLDARGMLDETLIVVTGEFGRTPKINGNAGRDHWPECHSVLLVGGGVAGGGVHGSSDRLGQFPASSPATPGDLAATIFWRFGIAPGTEIHDHAKRPYPLATGKPLEGLF